MIERIAILGTGLLGTSVGLALRAAGFRGSIAGWNRSPEQAQARAANGRHRLCRDRSHRSRTRKPGRTPRRSHLRDARLHGEAAPVLGPDQLVTDVGSTKRMITEAGMRLFNTPERAAFLPGHPMAGKERGGAALGDANLFRGAVWLFTDDPAAQRSPHSAALVKAGASG